MPVPRRGFMKLFGVSLGSLLLTRCQRTETPAPTELPVICYEPTGIRPPTDTSPPQTASLRTLLRLCWLRFGELAQKTKENWKAEPGENYGSQLAGKMNEDHRRILDDLTAAGEITAPVSDLIQEAYEAAVFHIWRLNTMMTCYEMVMVDYAPASAANLVNQSGALTEAAAGTPIAPATLEKIRTALERDLAFYALTDAEVQALYEMLLKEYQDAGETIPSFEDLDLALTPDVKAAARFLVDVLTGK
ncbi:MAG: hypothetical protein JW929_12160 [Anaerolineales bacterium]|nr:hypothetical protein [Anaerolineales bacterium]